ncbi:hypothetical protein [Deinococcus navajonensis]|uniref:Lipoprotein n=1 Tax=Deinococcus navajonensis TaxID=309884 RepID=A0ABV8XUB1_9DEIO
MPNCLPALLPALLAGALLSVSAVGQSSRPEAVKVSSSRCGAYTVQLRQNGFDDPEDSVSLLLRGRPLVTLRDVHVSRDFCGDLTGDGVPEVILGQFSGGAHCCFVYSIYSLTTPLRRILYAPTAHSDGFEITQLDGRGPKELVTGDWRFAYAYGLSFADSPALPQVYAFRAGQYVMATRDHPQFLLRTVQDTRGEDYPSGAYLANYAVQVLAGRSAAAEAYVKTLPAPDRQWLENYLPDIRQSLSSAGIEDWPYRAGVGDEGSGASVGGAFTAPGRLELLAAVREKGGQASLRLYREQAGRVTSSAALATFSSFQNLGWPLGFSVRRSDGRDDFVLHDTRSGSVRLPVYRVAASGLTERGNDPLATATRLLGDLASVARHTSSLYRSSVRTDEQRRIIRGRIAAARTRAEPWLDLLGSPLPLATLGAFEVQALEVSRENGASALVAGTLDLGFTQPGQSSEYVDSTRQTVAVFLEKRAGTWTVVRWQLTPRRGEGPMYR